MADVRLRRSMEFRWAQGKIKVMNGVEQGWARGQRNLRRGLAELERNSARAASAVQINGRFA